MKWLGAYLLFLLFYTTQYTVAQCTSADHRLRHYMKTAATTATQADGYDVRHVFLDISMTNLSASISGQVMTRATVVAPELDTIVFELSDVLHIDSVKVNGNPMPVYSDAWFRSVLLPAALQKDDTFSLQVFYQGVQESGGNFIGKGITHLVDDRWNVPVTYTLSEPYFARDWWPCKQSLTDKIDSADIWITVPPGLKAGSNGLLQQVTLLPDGYQRYEWKTRYPVDYYLISASVAPYQEYARYMHFTNSSDSMLLQEYIYDHPGVLPLYKNAIDSMPLLVNYFSDLFGRYPFYKEKYGHCLAPMGGGMEHQTMTTLRSFNFNLVVHELAHQWFGNYVTCGSWRDLWLNEGFATYSEYLANHYFKGEEAAMLHLEQMQNRVYEYMDGAVYVADTSDIYRLFDGRLTYAKAGAVLHTLRYIIDNDSLFFPAIRHYLAAYAFGTATTEDLNNILSRYAQKNMDTFFRQWVYGEGYPHFELRWNQVNDRVVVQLDQTTTAPVSVPLFTVPVEVRFSSGDRDTVIRMDMDQPRVISSFPWQAEVHSVAVDPDRWLLHTETVLYDTDLLDLNTLPAPHPVIYPNPATTGWRIVLMPADTELRLLDISGRELLRQHVAGTATELKAQHLAKGVYLLELRFPTGQKQYHKLWKH